MRYADGGGLTAAERARRERVRLEAAESGWSHLKMSLANLAKRDIAQLTALVKIRLRRMQYQPGLVEGYLTGTRLDLTSLL
jgi:putative transposase